MEQARRNRQARARVLNAGNLAVREAIRAARQENLDIQTAEFQDYLVQIRAWGEAQVFEVQVDALFLESELPSVPPIYFHVYSGLCQLFSQSEPFSGPQRDILLGFRALCFEAAEVQPISDLLILWTCPDVEIFSKELKGMNTLYSRYLNVLLGRGQNTGDERTNAAFYSVENSSLVFVENWRVKFSVLPSSHENTSLFEFPFGVLVSYEECLFLLLARFIVYRYPGDFDEIRWLIREMKGGVES